MPQRITLHAGVDAFRGYGLHLIEICRHFLKNDIYPSIRPIAVAEGLTPLPADIRSLIVSNRQPEEWELLLAPPHHLPTPGRKTVFFTMWESSELPDPCLNMVNKASAVIVPSRWCHDVFLARGGLKVPIFIVPLGVDASVFRYRAPKQDGPTMFACAGRTQHGRERKGMDAVIRSFLAAFPYDKNVRLRVKCHSDCELPKITDPRIEVNRKHLSQQQVADWLADSHCFVSAAQGEGWGLWQHQAMAVGRPVIAAVYGGLREFMGEGNCYPVAFREGPTAGQWCGKWAYPDLGSMVEQMRAVHADRFTAKMIGVRAAETVLGLSWENSCNELVHVLGVIGALKENHDWFWMPKLTHADYSIPRTPSVLEQCSAKGWKASTFTFTHDTDEVVFNPSLTAEHLFVRYSKTTDGNRPESSIWVKRPDIFSSQMQKIELPGFKGDWFEDPRAMTTKEGFAMSYTRVSQGCPPTQEIAFLDHSLNVLDVWHPDIGGNGTSSKTATAPNKNWAWFLYEGDWYVIHWLEPMQVYRLKDGRVVDKWETFHPNKQWMHGIRHGGGHPWRIGGSFFGFCHSLMPWYGANRSRYAISCYEFEAKPPFKMTRLSRAPLLFSEDDIRGNPCSCIIAGSAELKDDVWTLALGDMDERCLTVEIPHETVIKSMDEL